MLVLAMVFAPAFAGGKDKPVAHVGDLGRPAAILFGQTLAPAQPLDDLPDLQEFGFRVLRIVRTGQGRASSEPVKAPSVQARNSLWKSRMSASGVGCASIAM